MRPEVAAEVREWLARAADDLREAEHDLTAAPPLARGAVFHSQQAAEKMLKAVLAAHERPLRRTHDLDELGRAVQRLDPTLADVIDRAKDLDAVCLEVPLSRTPLEPDKDETRDALARAHELYEAVLARLPSEVHP